jgi:hypothetical protein
MSMPRPASTAPRKPSQQLSPATSKQQETRCQPCRLVHHGMNADPLRTQRVCVGSVLFGCGVGCGVISAH